MKRVLILAGSYIVLTLGIMLGVVLLLCAVLVFVRYPQGNLQKKVMVTIGLLIAGIIVILASISLFEFMHEIIGLEQEIKEIETRTNLHLREGRFEK